jgi:hypothetical protein
MAYPSYLVHFNPNHDPKSGRFTFKKLGSIFSKKTSEKIVDTWKKNEGKSKKVVKISEVANQPSTTTTVAEKKPGSDFRTPELDEEYKKVTAAKIPNYSKLGWYDDDDINLVEKWGKESVNAADVGLKALNKVGRAGYDEKVGITNSDRSWFMFEDQTVGYPDIAYLACQGKSADEIKSIMDSNYKCSRANAKFDEQYKYGEINSVFGSWENFEKSAPYPDMSWALEEYRINGEGDPYIDACVEYAKEYRDIKHYISDGEDFIMHYNKNHSKSNGQFVSGDGDGDGIANDHKNGNRDGIQTTGYKYTRKKTNGSSNKESDALAVSAANKVRNLMNLQLRKEAAEKAIASNPRAFGKSKEREEYLNAMKNTENAFNVTKSLINDMSKRNFSNIDYDFKIEEKTGEQYVVATVTDKLGNVYVSELYTGMRAVD